MALEFYMVGLIVEDMNRSLDFYHRLGLALPEGSEGQPHVEVKMSGGLTFFLNDRKSIKELEDARIILEFYLKERAAVDTKYTELVEAGYQGHHAPFVTAFGMYFATINDPDGNTILLSAD